MIQSSSLQDSEDKVVGLHSVLYATNTANPVEVSIAAFVPML